MKAKICDPVSASTRPSLMLGQTRSDGLTG